MIEKGEPQKVQFLFRLVIPGVTTRTKSNILLFELKAFQFALRRLKGLFVGFLFENYLRQSCKTLSNVPIGKVSYELNY